MPNVAVVGETVAEDDDLSEGRRGLGESVRQECGQSQENEKETRGADDIHKVCRDVKGSNVDARKRVPSEGTCFRMSSLLSTKRAQDDAYFFPWPGR